MHFQNLADLFKPLDDSVSVTPKYFLDGRGCKSNWKGWAEDKTHYIYSLVPYILKWPKPLYTLSLQ